jgi:hypothetical protein
MSRRTTLAVVLILSASASGFGQDWAKKMFETTSHDFGTLAQGEKAEYDFVVENPYSEDVHITSVHASCGCAKPEVKQDTLRPHEKAAITVKFDAAVFLGSKTVTITVTFDRPFDAEVQLHLQAAVRGDTVVEPVVVNFGTVEENCGAEKTLKVSHKGSKEWRITAIRSANPHLSAEVREIGGSNGQVSYQVVVRLQKDFPSGRVCEHLILVTNDSASSDLPIPVEGLVAGAIVVSPESMLLGVVEPGQKTTRELVVRGKQPFCVTKITCEGAGFTVAAPDKTVEKQLHLIPVTFVAPREPGRAAGTIRLETSLGTVSPVTVTATVVLH